MPLSLYDMTVPAFISGLKSMSKVLEKGREHAAGKEEAFVQAKIFDDMGNLAYQIQRMSDSAKGLAVRLGKAEPVVMEDNETTFPELQERIAKTLKVLESLDPHSMDGMEKVEVKIGDIFKFPGDDYVTRFAIPNFYFHMTTAYDILRMQGTSIGKRDFLGMV